MELSDLIKQQQKNHYVGSVYKILLAFVILPLHKA